jgi:hypothetical protein
MLEPEGRQESISLFFSKTTDLFAAYSFDHAFVRCTWQDNETRLSVVEAQVSLEKHLRHPGLY